MKCKLAIIWGLLILVWFVLGLYFAWDYWQKQFLRESLPFKIIAVYPHSQNSFTQGLFFNGEILYESTGSPDYLPETRSVLGMVDLTTGDIEVKAELDRSVYFGEGSTVLNGKIYQLTYKSQKAFVWDAEDFELVDTFSFPSKEGWGLTTDGVSLIMSDGTDRLTYLDPNNFSVRKQLLAQYQDQPQYNLNELEYVSGYLYANIYQTNQIVKIDPTNGEIIAGLDLSIIVRELLRKYPDIAELNGIAYRASSETFFITGKLWPYIYELRLQN